MDEESIALVIDNGSLNTKAGFAGDEVPKALFATVVVPETAAKSLDKPTHGNTRQVGNEAHSVHKVAHIRDVSRGKDTWELAYPIERGLIRRWDDMEAVWHHTFYHELRVQPEEHPVMLTEPPFAPKEEREKKTKIMFETFNTPSVYIARQSVLSMYACGRTTGVVLDSGYQITHAVPVYEGYFLPHAVQMLEVAGQQATDYLLRRLESADLRVYGMDHASKSEVQIGRDIKEKLGYVALDFDFDVQKADLTKDLEKQYELPDGKIITIGSERFRCSEILFQPDLVGNENAGIHQMIHAAVTKCDEDIRNDMYLNIVLSGGCTMFPGLDERLTKELVVLLPDGAKIKVVAPLERKYSAWIGGSMLASLSSSFKEQMWITKDEYDEEGSGIIHKKCF